MAAPSGLASAVLGRGLSSWQAVDTHNLSSGRRLVDAPDSRRSLSFDNAPSIDDESQQIIKTDAADGGPTVIKPAAELQSQPTRASSEQPVTSSRPESIQPEGGDAGTHTLPPANSSAVVLGDPGAGQQLRGTLAQPHQPADAYVAICAAVKDQHPDVREWIFYHRAVGINKFYLTDTGSQPPMQSVLEDHIQSGLVEYTYDTKVPPRKGTHGPQVTIYERCLHDYGHRHTFMAFIDVDEFLILRDGTPDIPTLLRGYEQYGGLVVNWVMFGSSGLQARPVANTLMSYWKCAPEDHPENCHVKSIVRPPHVADSATDPHHFQYKQPLTAVNTRHEVVKGPKSNTAALDRLALYHYSIKSREDFAKKMARGSGMGNQKTMEYMYYIDNFTTADCLGAMDVGMQMASFAVY